MSNWQTEKAEQNRNSFARLSKSLPAIFPPAVLSRALNRPFIPPTPRLAVESYWRAHTLRAESSLSPNLRISDRRMFGDLESCLFGGNARMARILC
jgi:hypothetical protein